ncbi:glycosyltransferase family 9 protein [Kiloniella sp. b19]|uniref:glycosyltransferase family 9 protein n=1 Tax=Kiloniella sp. GXU_MW_B19 TaxID=3141326 RepID=UPI0031D24D92
MPDQTLNKILIIKLSAFGDFVLSIRSFQAIRAHHPRAHITLLTTTPFVRLAQSSGLFDKIEVDERPRGLQIGKWLRLRKWLNNNRFDRVYDLQRNDRSASYFRLLSPRPEWVGKVKGCSHCQMIPDGTVIKVTVREDQQLALAGIQNNPLPDMSFITADISGLNLPERFAVLVPGGAPHRPDKRWPAEHFAALARSITQLAARDITPVLLGTKAERAECDAIASTCPQALNLCGQTSLEQIAVLARRALFAVGNDTGPMHMLSTNGCPVLVLYSKASDPRKIHPIGPDVHCHQVDDLAQLGPEEVLERLPFSTV